MKGILINYEYCTGCHSCELACRNELGLGKGEYGIKLTEVGPFVYTTDFPRDTPYEWVYNPTITKACDLCVARTEMGKMPSCVQACQAWCMYYGDLEELITKMDGKTRWALYTPVLEVDSISDVEVSAPKAAKEAPAKQAAAAVAADEAPAEAVQQKFAADMVVNFTIKMGEDKFAAFVEENTTMTVEEAAEELKAQLIANAKSSKFTVPADKVKEGGAAEMKCTAVVMDYDAQGTQLGGGKAYLDKGQEIARKDITVMFM